MQSAEGRVQSAEGATRSVMVLGASGMLGSMVADVLRRVPEVALRATLRTDELRRALQGRYGGVSWSLLDAERASEDDLAKLLGGCAWVVNAIGVIKPYIHDDNPAEIERAVRVNALFPHLLAKAAERAGTQVIQIATDCVYSGSQGNYRENAPHDALDAYGKTKSLGEVRGPNMHHLRVSIIGPELKGHLSLLDWFRGQKPDAVLNGFTNHSWNGVTTLHFARLCRGIIGRGISLPHVQHVVPGDRVNKHELLRIFAQCFNRGDIKINAAPAPAEINRTLSTSNEDLNARLWSAAGCPRPPTIEQMVAELASRCAVS